MELLAAILSSAVISAIISYLSNAKNNQLKYVTSERSEWRKEVKKIISDLMECKKYNDKAKKLLADLKLRINSYGMKKEYPQDICLNYFRDEHIWKEIQAIEQGGDFKTHMERLVEYVSLSLKFDWERSKHETKLTKKYAVLVVYLGIIVFSVIIDLCMRQSNAHSIQDVIIEELSLFLLQIIPLMFYLAPSLYRYFEFIKAEESYKRFAGKFICYIVGFLIQVLSFMVIKNGINIGCIVIEIILGFLLFFSMLFSDLYLRDYSNAIRGYVEEKFITIYTNNSNSEFIYSLWAETVFNNYGISYYNTLQLGEDIIEVIGENQKCIRLRSRISYQIWNYRSCMGVREFLKRYPKSCKILIIYGDELVIGFKRDKWKELAENILNNKDEEIKQLN